MNSNMLKIFLHKLGISSAKNEIEFTSSYHQMIQNMLAHMPSHTNIQPGSVMATLLDAIAQSQADMYQDIQALLDKKVDK